MRDPHDSVYLSSGCKVSHLPFIKLSGLCCTNEVHRSFIVVCSHNSQHVLLFSFSSCLWTSDFALSGQLPIGGLSVPPVSGY